MNQFTIAVLVLVVFCYFGGKYCPSVLKQNKQILLGVVGGLVLASFFGFKLEGAMTGHGGVAFGDGSDCCDVKAAMEDAKISWNERTRGPCPLNPEC